jgi:hypothetical protein
MKADDAGELIAQILCAMPSYRATVITLLERGQTYERWRADFQTNIIDAIPHIQAVLTRIEKRDGIDREDLLRAVYTHTRTLAAKGKA